MIPFNYHHLYYFYIIAKEGSISKASKQLRLAQPTLSTQLKQFETFLNVQLFIRENRHLTLTEEGHRVLSYAKAIFDIGQEMKDRMIDLTQKGRMHIHIGLSNYVPKTIVELLLDFILTHEPDVHIVLSKEKMPKLTQDLQDNLLDLILTDTPFEGQISGEMQNNLIGKIPIVFCAHPQLARQLKKFPQSLNGTPLFLPASPRQLFYTIQEYLFEHQLKPKIIGEIEDIEIIRRLVLRQYGVAPLNLLTVREAPSNQQLTILNKTSKNTIFEKIYLITKKKKTAHPLVKRILTNFHMNDLISKH